MKNNSKIAEVFSLSMDELIENYKFIKYLEEHQIERRVYFDASDIIDMLQGINYLFRGYSLQKHRFYNKASMIHAMAYREWLGPIYLLSPHLAELVHKLKFNQHIFPENRKDKGRVTEDELYGTFFPEKMRFTRQYQASLVMAHLRVAAILLFTQILIQL